MQCPWLAHGPTRGVVTLPCVSAAPHGGQADTAQQQAQKNQGPASIYGHRDGCISRCENDEACGYRARAFNRVNGVHIIAQAATAAGDGVNLISGGGAYSKADRKSVV